MEQVLATQPVSSTDMQIDTVKAKLIDSDSPIDLDNSPGNTESSGDSDKESPRTGPKVYKKMAIVVEAVSSYDPHDEQMPELEKKAWAVRENAYCPYSGFKVGSAMRSANTGKIYVGCNVENAAYPTGVCAERSALCQAVAAEGPSLKLDHVVVATVGDEPAQPCGPCR